MNIPTIIEISPTNLLNLDERVAYRHFFGKTLSEARILFGQSDMYADDLMWMGYPAFEYYVDAYIDHLNTSDCENLDARIPMAVVMGRFNFDDIFIGVKKLIEAISSIRRRCSEFPSGSFSKEYDAIARQITLG